MMRDRIVAVVPIHGPDPNEVVYYLAGVVLAGVLVGAVILYWVDRPRRRQRELERRGFEVKETDRVDKKSE